ncbi:MAG: holo-ACP synthase [Candidatus Heimdallarchaeota archaeon]|nr:MAG: holo-ACP synthase [Candidatus Heimdallarchaeota archaeon]
MKNWFIGIDIIEIQRFRAFPPSKHPRFYAHVFSEYEFQYCSGFSDPYPHLAGIFAAKEAIFKAVNKLLPIKLTQITIQHDENGKPVVWPEDDMISPPIGNKWLNNNHNLEVQVSIAHSSELAIAWALVFSISSDYDLLEELNEFEVELEQEVYDELLKYRCIS